MEIQESIMISGGGGGARESYNDPFPIQDSVMISLTGGGGAISTKPLTIFTQEIIIITALNMNRSTPVITLRSGGNLFDSLNNECSL